MNSDVSTQSRIVILAAVDDTSASEDVVRTAALLGQRFPGSVLHLAHVARPPNDADGPGVLLSNVTSWLDDARIVMDRVGEGATRLFSGPIVRHVAVGVAWREILQLATNVQADLIVVGSHQRNRIERWMLGSVSEQVVRKASCAVLVARPKDYDAAIPEIEPPCNDCLTTQKQSNGDKLWCDRHQRSKKHPQARLHYEIPQSFAMGSQLIRPEG